MRGADQASPETSPEGSHRELFSQMTAPAPRYVLVSTAGEPCQSTSSHALSLQNEGWSACQQK